MAAAREYTYVRALLDATDASPTSTEKPLNYTQLQLVVQRQMLADMEDNVASPFMRMHYDLLTAIAQHMDSRFGLRTLEEQHAQALARRAQNA